MAKKSTNQEIHERVNVIYQFLIKSWSRFDILQYAATEWDLSSRQTDEYIARAHTVQQVYFGPSDTRFPCFAIATTSRL